MIFISAIAVIVLFCATFVSCTQRNDAPSVDYTDIAGNSYNVNVTDTSEYKSYIPLCSDIEYGMIFYLGTAMKTSNYDFILEKIARAGIAVYVPANPFPDLAYSPTENGYEILKLGNYFIGGHSQGGGAAIRRAAENLGNTAGLILFSPMISNQATLKDTSLPCIYFEAENDFVLTQDMQDDAKSRLSANCRYVLLKGAGHMCYGNSSLLDQGGTVRDKTEIQNEVTSHVLEFMQNVIDGESPSSAV